MTAPKCECCSEPNAWCVLDEQFSHCCKPCVDEGLADMAEGDEVYREIKKCRCGHSGPINYDDGQHTGYYCGGSERCIP